MEPTALPQISNDDLMNIVEIFRNSIKDSVGEPSETEFDINKVVNQFENTLRTGVKIIQTPAEEVKGQQIKGQIEKMQQQAYRLQEQIKGRKNAFIESIRNKIDQYLDGLLPELSFIDMDQPIEIPDEVNQLFDQLDEQISSLEKQVKASNVSQIVNQLSTFVDSTMNFLNQYNE